MRRIVLLSIFCFGSLLAVACSDGGSDATTAPAISADRHHGEDYGGYRRHHPIACRQFGDDVFQDLFKPGTRGLVRADIAFIRLLMRRGKTVDARNQMFQLWDLVLKAYYRGDLKGGTSNDTQDNVLELGQLLYCLVGLDGSGLALGDALGDGDVTQVVFPSDQNTDVVHGDGDGGLRVPPGAINAPVTVTISLITDPFDPFKGPLNTKLDQYGPFFLFEVVPLDALVQPVDIAQCFDNAPPASTHIAHNVGTGIEILGRESPFLDCSGTATNPPSAAALYARGETWGAMKAIGRSMARAILPGVANAGGVGVGGKTSSFSPYGGVDTAVVIDTVTPSNIFQFAPAGSAVPVPPKVWVHTTGAKTPLDGANVLFAVTSGGGSLTGSSAVTDITGTASASSWTINAGANTVSATASFPPPAQGGNIGVDGNPIVFTATGGDIIPWEGDGYKYLVGTADQTPGFEATGFNDASWSTGRGGFGDHSADNLYCPLDASVHTNWVSVPSPTDMLLRHTFTIPAGWTQSLTLSIAIDNDIQIFINGNQITDGLLTHEGCATRGSSVFTIPASMLVAGTNVLAIRARDRGTDAFVDAQLTVTPPSP